MNRVTVFENGTNRNGKIIGVAEDFHSFLIKINLRFNSTSICKIFDTFGSEIVEVEIIRDNETLYVSKGEDFKVPVASLNFHNGSSKDWIKLNIGGTLFYLTRTTIVNLEPECMLAKMFSPDSTIQPSAVDATGAYLIDRSPIYFEPIVNYLRTGQLIINPDVNPEGVLLEAQFYGMQSIIHLLESRFLNYPNETPLNRSDVVKALITTPNKSILRFQGVNLNGADLSYLDLRNINFKFAKLKNAKLSHCNLAFCNFERADLSGVEMVSATLNGVRMANAMMEGANCANCNFQDPTGHNANMEGVNLRKAILEDSDLTGANLRVANLKSANLKATILRGAILAGADLENANLTGSDLHEANLRGANLKDAALELMINPLHMAQAIR